MGESCAVSGMKNGLGLTAHRSENPFSEADDDTDDEQAGGQDDPGR